MRVALILALVAGTVSPLAAQRPDTIVKQVGAPRYAGVATLVPEVTIGGADATDDEYIFVSIRVLLAAKDGSVWVSDGRFPMGPFSLRRYDVNGKFIRNVGARGQGPGEWQMPGHLAELRDGRVVLRDEVVGRPLTFYRANGDYDTTWAMHTTTISYINADTASNIWMSVAAGTSFNPGAPHSMVRMTPRGVVDTIPEPPRAEVTRAPNVTVTRGRSSMGFAAPYQPYALGAWSPQGYYATGVSSQYTVNLLRREGVTSIRRSASALAVSDDERSDQRAYLEARVAAVGGTQQGSIPDIPREKQIIRSIDFDLDGRLWVSVSQPSERYEPPPPAPARAGATPQPVLRWREPLVYELFEPNGTLLGRVTIPYDVRLHPAPWAPIQSRGDYVWGIATDADGVQSVRRYRIAWR
ncbi:MAG TPA: hypothetical protein VJR92_15880 [Gemmatimonadaceae bacterium]|nr:hypothetical protein [Gemmatimonadaceae bacterium]